MRNAFALATAVAAQMWRASVHDLTSDMNAW